MIVLEQPGDRRRLLAGNWFGAPNLLTAAPGCPAVALTPAKLLVIEAHDLVRLIERHPHLAATLRAGARTAPKA
jgi:CRP-like cAMP-binding protein